MTGPFSDAWNDTDSLAALAHALSANTSAAGDVPANCVRGNTGPFCGLCLPGYAIQSGECAPCNPKDAWTNWSRGAQAGLLIACLLFALVLLAFAFFQPIVPSLERAVGAALAGGRACFVRGKDVVTCGYLKSEPEGAAEQPDGKGMQQPRAEAEKEEEKGEQKVPRYSSIMREFASAEVSSAAAPAAVDHGAAEAAAGAAARHEQQPDAAAPRVGAHEGGERGLAAQRTYNNRALANATAGATGAVGAMALVDVDFDSGQIGDVELHEEHGFVEYTHDLMDALEDGIDRLRKYAKILVKCVRARAQTLRAGRTLTRHACACSTPRSFYQIVSTFIKSLDIPWPSSFRRVMARVSVININLVTLPKAVRAHALRHMQPLALRAASR